MRGNYPSYEDPLFCKNCVFDVFWVLKNLASFVGTDYERIFPLRHLEPCQIDHYFFLEQKVSLI